MVKYGETFAYNPVTISQFALTRFSQGQNDAVLIAANKLLSMQRKDGAFPYEFSYKHMLNLRPYKPGWISGMAQGQSLSALGRAYTISHDKRFLDAGNKALAFLQMPFPKGPMADLSDLDPSLSGYSFILEYPVKPHAYTLNGYLFAVIGLYDWWKITGSEDAHRLFDDAVRTLIKLVSYYDIGTASTYDIGYITQAISQPYLEPSPPYINAGYQGFHAELLAVMFDITGNPIFDEYSKRFTNQFWNEISAN
ncbi:hypothetical protein BFN67_15110 [Pseudaminobacter manganicus]|uniref:D-glucuronyl C5-epimerase C-terminal domain-containing protein n=1 Tax=Manganibacter manganicus TaxID=1873176 RepID=A0A1V8RSM1_9HYPH|nr:hypothetical protein BFN67_15110 [Pseudaminobacter manganicus]